MFHQLLTGIHQHASDHFISEHNGEQHSLAHFIREARQSAQFGAKKFAFVDVIKALEHQKAGVSLRYQHQN